MYNELILIESSVDSTYLAFACFATIFPHCLISIFCIVERAHNWALIFQFFHSVLCFFELMMVQQWYSNKVRVAWQLREWEWEWERKRVSEIDLPLGSCKWHNVLKGKTYHYWLCRHLRTPQLVAAHRWLCVRGWSEIKCFVSKCDVL